MNDQHVLPKSETRTWERIYAQYVIEKKLAERLKNADRHGREKLYKRVYDELYRSVPDHPHITRQMDSEAQGILVASKMKFLSGFLDCNSVFSEIGPGDCQISFEVAKYVKKVYAVDVSENMTKNIQKPANFELMISDGINIPSHVQAINIAYSNQFIEHVHPDDVKEMLQGIYKSLVPGGIYICFTPHRFNGPHDISKYFDSVALGLHMKEYTNEELFDIFKAVGFIKIKPYVNFKIAYVWIPISMVILLEKIIGFFPWAIRRKISLLRLFRGFLGICLVAKK